MSQHPSPPLGHHPDLAASSATVSVPATTVWTGPDRVRAVDALMVGAHPDLVGWLAAMDEQTDPEQGRLGLHGRVLTQLVGGEPVTVIDVTAADGTGTWSQVLAPWQPSPGSDGGYLGWVPSAHLASTGAALAPDAAAPSAAAPTAGGPLAEPGAVGPSASVSGEHPALPLAREHLGLRYLWGGLTPLGLDCSGLVHHTWRRLGLVVPRDAFAQAEASGAVVLDEVQPGDLYFFAHPDRRIHHVGIVVSRGRMLHASETGGVLVEEDLTPDRIATLVAAGRLPGP
ncbi:MAG: C40 family peptidase [Humibacillus sp.]|nr:C40 family peptidase [Humibacillus sp.]MDN5775953.1 C40 family peptidase [Humibacillus sp.]